MSLDVGLTPTNRCIEDEQACRYEGSGIEAQLCREFFIEGNIADAVSLITPKLDAAAQSIEGVPLSVISFEAGEKVKCGWRVTVCQSSPDRPGGTDEKGDDGYSFNLNVSSEQQLLPISYGTTCTEFDSDGNLIDNQFVGRKLISVNGCDVTGCPVTIPRKQYCETWCFPFDFIDKSWCLTAAGMIGHTNQFMFRDCQPCEMLMTGITASKQGLDGTWNINFCWGISPNVVVTYPILSGFDSLSGGGINFLTPLEENIPIGAGGWDHIVPKTHCANTGIRRELFIEAVKVHQVYPKADFSILGI